MEIFGDIRAGKNDPVLHGDFDDLKLAFYVVCVVFGGAIVIIIGAVIGLYVWILKMKKSLGNNGFPSGTMGRSLKPNEELAKRYQMSVVDDRRSSGGSTLDHFPFNKQSLKKPDIIKNENPKNNYAQKPEPPKHFDTTRSQPQGLAENKRFGDKRFGYELYY